MTCPTRLPGWPLRDNINSPSLGEHIRVALLTEFDGIQNPRVGMLQDNLAASADEITGEITGRPMPAALGEPLFASQSDTFIMFEALQGWNCPFGNPDNTANAMPSDGIEFALNTYSCTYFQLYLCDIDEAAFWPGFESWAAILSGDPDPPSVPTTSEWGLVIMALLLVITGSIVVARREHVVA